MRSKVLYVVNTELTFKVGLGKFQPVGGGLLENHTMDLYFKKDRRSIQQVELSLYTLTGTGIHTMRFQIIS
jgi:hypothetical protein